jgi:hypothetical protein
MPVKKKPVVDYPDDPEEIPYKDPLPWLGKPGPIRMANY